MMFQALDWKVTTHCFDGRVERSTIQLGLRPVDVCGVAQAWTGEFTAGDARPPPIIPVLAVALPGDVFDVVPFTLPLRRRTAFARQAMAVKAVQPMSDRRQPVLRADGRGLSGLAWCEDMMHRHRDEGERRAGKEVTEGTVRLKTHMKRESGEP